jgi:AsmA protein
MKKAVVIILSSIVIIAVLSALLVKFIVTPENVKHYLIPAAEKSLNRKIDVGEVSISLFKGIDLRDFALKEAGADSVFFRCSDFVLKFRLLPLLAKKLIVDELRMVRPELNIVRDAAGRYNFEGIGGAGSRTNGNDSEISQGDGAIPVSMLISKVSVEDGSFSLKDFLKKLPDIKSTINMKIRIESAGESGIQSSGRIDVMIDEANLRIPKAGRIRNFGTSLEYDATVDIKRDTLKIEKADLPQGYQDRNYRHSQPVQIRSRTRSSCSGSEGRGIATN